MRPLLGKLLNKLGGDNMFLREFKELWIYHKRFTKRFAEHDFHNVFEKTIRDLRIFGFAGLDGKNVLDLSCSQRYPFALICAAHGAKVTALDIDYIKSNHYHWLFIV